MTNSPSADGSIKPGRDGAAMRDIAASPPDQVASQRQTLRPSAEIDALQQPVVSPVVGIGASAGGLKSLQELLSCLPVDTGMAFVVVSHMDSTHESLLPSLLANSTGMPVQDVRNKTVVEPNRVYVIMPGTEIRLAQGALHASPRSNAMPHMPIDDFFATLARELRNRAIGVTGFFRDPGVFEALRTVVFPEIMAHPSSDRTIRVWVPGCATGEEAYSIAICLLEVLGNQADCLPIQIFATDINELGLERARAGVYPLSIAKDVSAEQLQRFFSPTDGGYKVNPRVREVCVFAKQNVFKDPPFSKLDLISCRNVLIYFGHLLQKRIFPFLHYALNPHGFLVLGSAETVGGFHDLFAVHDKQHKIYQKRPVRTPLEIAFTARPNDPQRAAPYSSSSTVSAAAQTEDEMFHQVERMILSRYGPNGLLVRDDMEIVQFYGNAGELVEPAPGKASLNLLKMIRQDAAFELRAMMHAAGKDKRPVRRAGLTFSVDGTSRRADVEVLPLSAGPGADNFYFVLLKDPAQDGDGSPSGAGASSKAHDGQPVPEDHGEPARLQAELTAAKDYLQSIIEEQESAHEELKSANEETLTSNEELQSTNEELETAKEELQSANEELTTLNDELQGRNRQMVQVNDDLVNLLGSVNIPIVMLNSNLQIRHFTPTAERVLNLVASDVGRPLAHINFNINVPHLEQMVTEVIQTVVIKQREVRDRQGRWYSLRIRPYLTRENKIDGAVLALLDITELKQTQQRALQTERLAAIGQTVAAIAHESRNMLQQLQWGVDLLQSLVGSSSEAEEALQLIYEQQSNLQRLFDDLQGFAAPIHLERRMAHLGAIWKGAIDAMIPLTKDRRVNIASWPSGPDDYCSLDLFRIQQVFRNLLENSLAACTEPVDIHINCRDTDLHGEPAICLSIRDNGPGLTADQRERVFDAFYTTKPRGTGLGLAICKRIVDAHGGLIEVGAFPERGTEILITLPRQPLP